MSYGMKVIDIKTGEHIFTLSNKPSIGDTLICDEYCFKVIEMTDHPRKCFVERYYGEYDKILISTEIK